MDCPKCGASMKSISLQGVEVERCEGCQGLWLDHLELERIEEKKLARALDTGEPDSGSATGGRDRIPCPKCQGTGKMTRMVAAGQSHIWFEHCGVCHGSYFDAGELRDITEHTLSDYIRDLLTPERPA